MGFPSPPTLERQGHLETSLVSNSAQKSECAPQLIGKNNHYQTAILTNLEDIQNFEQNWRALEISNATSSNVFQSYDWCMNWVKTCAQDNDCYGIYIIAVFHKGQCQLIWPMMTTCSGPFHILRWLSEPYSQYGDVLLDKAGDINALLNIAWAQIKSHPIADSIRFRHVRQDANIAVFLSANARRDAHIDYAPYLELEKYPTQAIYDNRYNKSQRRRRKRIRNSLEKQGPLSFTCSSKGQNYQASLQLAIIRKKAWLEERGLYSKPVMSPELMPFFIELANSSKTLLAFSSSLKAGKNEVSCEIGIRYKGRHLGYITAHDPALTDYSPGRLHMDLSQKCAINDGMETFDLMVPADPHKKTWSSAQVQTRDYFTHLNIRGAIYSLVYLKTIRPAVRWIYLKAPKNVRRNITRFVS